MLQKNGIGKKTFKFHGGVQKCHVFNFELKAHIIKKYFEMTEVMLVNKFLKILLFQELNLILFLSFRKWMKQTKQIWVQMTQCTAIMNKNG